MSLEKVPGFLLKFSADETEGEAKHSYRFKSFRLDVAERQLLHHNSPVPLTPKAFDVLAVLVERSGHLVEKEELLKEVWADSFVEEANISRIIHTLRRALGEDADGNKFIETIATKGYRFVAEVTEEPETQGQQTGKYKGLPAEEEDFPDTIDVEDSAPAIIQTPRTQSPIEHKRPRRIIFLTVGFAAAISLTFLLSFNFWSRSTANSAPVRSLAVLPLKPINSLNRDEIYEIGIADSLILRLSSLKGFVVRPLSATRKYADIEQDAMAAGLEQKVDYVLASNYQLADGKIRITSQLLNVASGQIEESYKGEKDATDLFAMQDAIAGDVGTLLQGRFATTSGSPTEKRGTNNEEAYRLYIQGAALVDKRNDEDVRKAVEYLEQAVRIDPNYALAYARLANALNAKGVTKAQYPNAKAAIEKALAIDDSLAEAHSYFGEIKSDFEGDFAGAEREHKRALELDPSSAVAHRMYALLLTYLGRHEESIAEIKTAIDLEPASVLDRLVFGRSLMFARRYDAAIIELERAVEMDPEFYFAHLSLSLAYRLKGDDDRSFASFIKTRTLGEDDPEEINDWKAIYARSGWQGISARQLEQAKASERNGKPNYSLLANLSTDLGKREEAFVYLEKALSQQGALTMLRVHPRFDLLRSDPRFDELLMRVGLK